MTNEYSDINARLLNNRVEIRAQQQQIETLRHPEFDALKDVDVEFPRFEISHENAFEFLVNANRRELGVVQDELISSCIARLTIAMGLIETQMALTKRPDMKVVFAEKASLEHCIEEDFNAVRGLYERAEILKANAREKHLPSEIDELWYELSLADITAKQRDLQEGKIARSFRRVSKEELVGQIFQARHDYAALATEDVSQTLIQTRVAIHDAMYLKVAVDEGILQRDPVLDKMVSNSLGYADLRLAQARSMVRTIGDFLADIYEMGRGDYGVEGFKVTNYRPVTIRTLPQLAP